MNKFAILLIFMIGISFGILSIFQLSWSQQPTTIDITKLTGKEKIEISGIINIKRDTFLNNTYEFSDKPLIKMDGQPLDFEFAADFPDYISVDDSSISISMKIKTPFSSTTSKVLNIDLNSHSDIIKDNPNGSKTYANEPNKSGETIKIGDIVYRNVASIATVNGSIGFIKAEANNNTNSTATIEELPKTSNTLDKFLVAYYKLPN